MKRCTLFVSVSLPKLCLGEMSDEIMGCGETFFCRTDFGVASSTKNFLKR
jgi:hypothetical protein